MSASHLEAAYGLGMCTMSSSCTAMVLRWSEKYTNVSGRGLREENGVNMVVRISLDKSAFTRILC